MKKYSVFIAFLLSFALLLSGCGSSDSTALTPNNTTQTEVSDVNIETPIVLAEPKTDESEPVVENKQPEAKAPVFDLDSFPDYSGKAYVAVNGNIPYFTKDEYSTTSFERYSSLDSLGRCGVAYANIGQDIMPTEERGSIGSVKPSGWHTIKYENVDGKYLYNRCHLVGFQLSGENANERNLITGTRYMNIKGMLPFENMVADYVQETNNHVLFRVTPIFNGNNLLADGVLMEGLSMEDDGAGVTFCVFCYNVQPGIIIDYATGDSKAEDGSAPYGSSVVTTPKQETPTSNADSNSNATSYIGNKNTKKFHYPYCHSVDQMKEKNKKYMTCTREQAISQGYSPCGNCNP